MQKTTYKIYYKPYTRGLINENQRNELIDIINNVNEIWDYTYLKKLEI